MAASFKLVAAFHSTQSGVLPALLIPDLDCADLTPQMYVYLLDSGINRKI
jgi:hypothetical protein